jgi:hypothetical protein
MSQVGARPVRVAAPDDLLQPALLEALFGPIASVSVQPLPAHGYSGAVLERLEVRLSAGGCQRLIHKRVRLAQDWTAYRSNDGAGRQAALLAEPRLRAVWDVLVCPYRAYAVADGELGLLMTDLDPWLLPDVDAPLSQSEEDQLLAALAGLHARYWRADLLDLGWLARPEQVLRVLGPEAPRQDTGRPLEPLFEMIRAGWAAALAYLPSRVADWLLRPPHELLDRLGSDLPRTLLHGDAKVANFALLPTGVAAFDWSWVGAGPSTFDLGWYLAVNAGRLARPKEAVLSRYRELLQQELGHELPESLWARLVTLAMLVGARLLLWEKALALKGGSPRATHEWAWWLQALEQTVVPNLAATGV